jgi:hypothetical protein
MGKVLVKKIEIGGATVTLLALDGKNWSTGLRDLQRFEAERREIQATTQRAFRTIGSSDHWGWGRGRKRRAL